MSEILQKYKDKVEYLQQLGKAYQEMIIASINHDKKYVAGNAELEKSLDTLARRVKGVKNIFQIEQIKKEYAALGKKITLHLRDMEAARGVAPGGGGGGGFLSAIGSLFGGHADKAALEGAASAIKKARDRGEPIELIDAAKDMLMPYVSLLDYFSKGTMLISEDKDPIYPRLMDQRRKKFSGLMQKESDEIGSTLYNFFINKSNEAATIENEREELKRIIGSLTGYIQSVAITSDDFGTKLDEYSEAVAQASNLDDIKKMQHAILAETLEIQKVNNAVRERLAQSEQQLTEAQNKILKLENDLEMARHEKSVDALTQVYNRGFFDETLNNAIAGFERNNEPASLILFDIDRFKKFNDTYGHQAGDQVLRVVAEITKESVRVSDIVARYGGEEFAVILSRAKLNDAVKVAENIRKNVGRHEFVASGKTLSITVSLGVTQFAKGDTPEKLVKRADKLLYGAKDKGRDCVVCDG